MAAMARISDLTAADRGSLREQAYERAKREARLFLSGPDRSYINYARGLIRWWPRGVAN